jgi:CHASE3 domain sensor protein
MELRNLRKFIVAFGAVVFVLAVTAFITASNLNNALETTNDLISFQEVVQATDKLQAALTEEQDAFKQYPQSGNDELLARIDDAQAEYDQSWEVIVKNRTEEQAQLIADIEVARGVYKDLLDEVIAEYQSDPDDNNSADSLTDANNYYVQNVAPKFSDLSEPELEKLAARVELEKASANRKLIGSKIVLVLSILVGIFVVTAVTTAIIFSQRLLQSMTSIIDASNAISRGDLDVPINIEQGGEIGELAISIDRMRTTLKAAIERLRR